MHAEKVRTMCTLNFKWRIICENLRESSEKLQQKLQRQPGELHNSIIRLIS